MCLKQLFSYSKLVLPAVLSMFVLCVFVENSDLSIRPEIFMKLSENFQNTRLDSSDAQFIGTSCTRSNKSKK